MLPSLLRLQAALVIYMSLCNLQAVAEVMAAVAMEEVTEQEVIFICNLWLLMTLVLNNSVAVFCWH